MISCPFCNKLVRDGQANDPELEYLEDDALQDFWCSTYIDVHPGIRWCHYSRRTMKGWHTEYEVIVPPFRLIWTSTINWLVIQQFNVIPDEWQRCVAIQELKEQTFEDFIKHANRMAKLKAFT